LKAVVYIIIYYQYLIEFGCESLVKARCWFTGGRGVEMGGGMTPYHIPLRASQHKRGLTSHVSCHESSSMVSPADVLLLREAMKP